MYIVVRILISEPVKKLRKSDWREAVPKSPKKNFKKQVSEVSNVEEENDRKNYDERAAKNCPSYLIWSLFTRKRELKKVQSLERKPNNSEGNQQQKNKLAC